MVKCSPALPLAKLDRLLRDVWLECCGHMSVFHIHGDEISKRTTAGKVFSHYGTIEYDYDFGTTTYLELAMIGTSRSSAGPDPEILIRNEMPEHSCYSCGMPDIGCCEGCGMPLCGKCWQKHQNNCDFAGDEIVCTSTNSPRDGVCGYYGGDDSLRKYLLNPPGGKKGRRAKSGGETKKPETASISAARRGRKPSSAKPSSPEPPARDIIAGFENTPLNNSVLEAPADNVIRFPFAVAAKPGSGPAGDNASSGVDALAPLKASKIAERAMRCKLSSKAVQLANQALEIDPECIEAYAVLGCRSSESFEKRMKFVERSLALAFNKFGTLETLIKKKFESSNFISPEPLLPPLHLYAEMLTHMKCFEESAGFFFAVIMLDDDCDHDDLCKALYAAMKSGISEMIEAYFDIFENPPTAYLYCMALHEYKKNGRTSRANELMRNAIEANRSIAGLFFGKRMRSSPLGLFHENEGIESAEFYLELFEKFWRETPGAVKWMSEHL